MKALILREYNKFEYTDIDIPEIKKNEVLIKVKACGICGSDIHGMDGGTGRRIPPIVMGHEASGIISKIGKDVKNWEIGNRVTFDSTIYCESCYYCLNGYKNLCDNRRVLGVSCNEYKQNGAFAEFIALPENILYKLPDEITFEEASMVEALSVAFHAVKRVPVDTDNVPVVVGAGMIGLLIIKVLKLSGYKNIIAIDVFDEKLNLAKQNGASFTFNLTRDNVKEEILHVTNNRGVDLAFEAVGITDTINTAIEVLKKGASLILVGNICSEIKMPLQTIVKKELTIYGSCASNGEYPECIDMIFQKKVDVKPFISAIAPLSEGISWFKRLYDHESGLMKVILKP